MTSLEDAIDADVETTIHNEEVELGISSPNEDDDEDDDEWLGGVMALPKLSTSVLVFSFNILVVIKIFEFIIKVFICIYMYLYNFMV